VQVSALGQQINSAMTAKQDMWTAKTAQLQDARQSEGQRLQSTEALTVTLMADADALKAQLQSETGNTPFTFMPLQCKCRAKHPDV